MVKLRLPDNERSKFESLIAAVGEHGKVYRYRVVPVEYTAKGMLPAPVTAAK